jgi:serine/threonine-protein phosphatase with EF-hand domain
VDRCGRHAVSQALRGTVQSDRGAGVLFGSDITENFCGINGISLVIRSHECMQEGFSVRAVALCAKEFLC